MVVDVSGVVGSIGAVLTPIALVGGAVLFVNAGIKAWGWVKLAVLGGPLGTVEGSAPDVVVSSGGASVDASQIRYVSESDYEREWGHSYATTNYHAAGEQEMFERDRERRFNGE